MQNSNKMDSRIGLDFIVENPEYIGKLAAALDTPNLTVKKQVFELLSALCVHNQEGHARALDTLEQFKKLKGERYRLSVIIQELDRATSVEYQTALVAFINCLIISTSRLTDRSRLRNEFIGCHLLPVLNNLRKSAEASPDLAIQLDVFDEQRDADDAQQLQSGGVDLNSPLDVFYAILKQVAETPQEIPFLSILQHLLRIDPKEPISDVIWDATERLVHRATLLENREDATKLLVRTPSIQNNKVFCNNCSQQNNNKSSDFSSVGGGNSRKQSLKEGFSPPPPPPILGGGLPPPPPPPPFMVPVPPSVPLAPQMHRFAAHDSVARGSVSQSSVAQPQDADSVIEKLPQQEIPQPNVKMKTINWNKIPSNKVVGKNNIWTQVACTHQHSPMADMDWSEMEGLFCQQAPPSAHSSPKLGNREPGGDNLDRRMRKESSEITLLDGKRSLNVNIFLKQFRSSNEDIIELIRRGSHDDIGAEKLKGLLKILPEVDELDMLKSFDGDFIKLGNAEKFLIQLTSLSNYKLRIESMLLKEEFTSNMSYLEPSINSMIAAAQDLMTNKPLQEVLYMILVAGNFLNSGGYAGGAAGVKLSSLQKITDIRANKPNMNLIHFVALQAEKRDKRLLSFTEKVSVLEDAAKTTVEQLHNEINALDLRIKKIKKQIDLPTTEHEIQRQMMEFLQMAETEVSNLQRDMVRLEYVRKQLADFFCEDINSFKLEECFRIFHGFYCKFRQAIADNERRRIQEEQANARRRQREELLASKRRQMESLAGTPDSDGPFIEMQIYDTRTGFPMKKGRKQNYTSEDEQSLTGSPSLSRRRLGSFNGQNGSDNITNRDEKSPDITPNGSLRRRRSRVLSSEDEGVLMDFLRASGPPTDTNRERKSWGSLDRSWARKARGSTARKRPALLAADFHSDRERPSSPSPLTEHKPIVSEESVAAAPKPKEWRQKIENWLQANESDQSNNEEVGGSRRRVGGRSTNRRSLEVDSESERSSTLDTLPEGKQVYSGGQSTYLKTFPAWEPSATIDNTDVVGAIETVEEMQPYQIKDKSAWRKSTLNVANSTEETRTPSPRHKHTSTTSLHSIKEDNDRKGLISSLGDRPATDKLTLYIQKVPQKQMSNLGHVSPTIRDSQQSIDTLSSNNKADIDQDNIETPPATRKVLFIPTPTEKREPVPPTPCRRMLNRNRETSDDPTSENVVSSLGDGQFDRFSAARRTRRYKRNSEFAEADSVTSLTSPQVDGCEGKSWQEKLTKSGGSAVEDSPTSGRGGSRRYRNVTGIDREDVKKALTSLNNSSISKTYITQPETLTTASTTSPSTTTQKIDIPSRKPSKEQHDNDEGFEETQSLMSESPSQGASSGGNYDQDLSPQHSSTTSPQIILASTTTKTKKNNLTRSNSAKLSSTASQEEQKKKSSSSNLDCSNKVSNNSRRLLGRASSLRGNASSNSNVSISSLNSNNNSTRFAPRRIEVKKKLVSIPRSDSLRKSDSNCSVSSRKSVEKSGSRSSIFSSRSSLNSATSASTVRRIPVVKSNATVKTSGSLRRAPSIGSATMSRPPRPQAVSSFMKPTTSSTTKIKSSSFRAKN